MTVSLDFFASSSAYAHLSLYMGIDDVRVKAKSVTSPNPSMVCLSSFSIVLLILETMATSLEFLVELVSIVMLLLKPLICKLF